MTLIAGCANASARVGQPSACCCAQTDGAVSSAVVPEGEAPPHWKGWHTDPERFAGDVMAGGGYP